ncbi:threonine ammonia-lyase [Novosphingobium cyanobacteriorum]|uniref:Pyridoxal-phosphate dependent enzyme n=1 Tax=Novosphingobium cyanobacteriorum TaxID=3024215 RepID=A0ABT6CJ29_9SPHN|nr:pyridoxal-phosphate dependent enzyme [Novosphingobium cyanobacteriorum]MDF8333928.1 pyridoxal-phosphate dependent enzyme [Novosphingobium cyanobacteriorum]
MTNPIPVDLPQPERAPTRDGVLRASAKMAELLPPTPLLPLDLPDGATVWCKAESLQPVGAFKIRGAWHRMTDLDAAERASGVVAVSSGNHAQGVAWAARRLGMAATIVMPRDAPAVKLDATRALGAEIVLYDRMAESRDAIARDLCQRTGAVLVHAYGDPWVIEGQGSTGTELMAQMERQAGGAPTRVVCPCGGGGLAAGLALACADADVVPVEPEGWDDVRRSLEAGRILPIGANPPRTACDALQTPCTFPVNFAVMQAHGLRAVAVSEAEVRAAQRFALAKLRLVVEPGGAAALAAVLAGKVAVDARTAIILSGGNVDPATFAAVIAGQD